MLAHRLLKTRRMSTKHKPRSSVVFSNSEDPAYRAACDLRKRLVRLAAGRLSNIVSKYTERVTFLLRTNLGEAARAVLQRRAMLYARSNGYLSNVESVIDDLKPILSEKECAQVTALYQTIERALASELRDRPPATTAMSAKGRMKAKAKAKAKHAKSMKAKAKPKLKDHSPKHEHGESAPVPAVAQHVASDHAQREVADDRVVDASVGMAAQAFAALDTSCHDESTASAEATAEGSNGHVHESVGASPSGSAI